MMNFVISPQLRQDIVSYYEEAGLDYAHWSRKFNMHFGLCTLRTLLRREAMLDRMSDAVLDNLSLDGRKGLVVDFGCGLGTTMRHGAARFPQVAFHGLTLVPWQREKGNLLTEEAGLCNNVRITIGDYHRTDIVSSSAAGVFAIESACYSPRNLHDALFREMYRVLEPGGSLVIADGFLKTSDTALPPIARRLYRGICRNWAMPGMMEVAETVRQLEEAGFTEIQARELSWRVAPSVLHVPFVILSFLLKKGLSGERLSRQSINNLKGSFEALLLGLHRRHFGYYMVTAKKRNRYEIH